MSRTICLSYTFDYKIEERLFKSYLNTTHISLCTCILTPRNIFHQVENLNLLFLNLNICS